MSERNEVDVNRLVSVTLKNAVGFLWAIALAIPATWIGFELNRVDPLPNWMPVVWWMMIGFQFGWMAGIWGMLQVAKYYSANSKISGCEPTDSDKH
jgi:hypothetical protein